MLNQVVLVGRISEEISRICDCGAGEFTLAIPSNQKNEDGEYDTNFIPVTLPANLCDNFEAYCKVGDIVGIKGHIEGSETVFWLIAEKVTFLSSKKD